MVLQAKKPRDKQPWIGLIIDQADTLLSTVDDMVGMEPNESYGLHVYK